MKKLLLLALIAFLPLWANAQKGISYQAVILDPNPIEIPGKDIAGQPFVNGSVWVKFALLSGSVTQFQEVHQTTTDGYGLVNLTIGSVANTAFNSLVWDSNQKTLQVYVSFNQGASYTKVSDQKLLYTPYSLYAETAGKLSGILGIPGGGTGASTAVGARANLGLGNVDNTADADKPISTATQSALNLKVDKVAGERLINAAEITKLSNQTGVNTGDQDLSSFATTSAVDAALALKAPLASPSFTGSPSTPTASQGTNSTQIASTEFVTKAIDINSKNSQLIYVPFSGANKPLNLGLYDLTVNDLTVGKGSGQKITNTALGRQSLWANTSGLDNTALGANTLLFNQTGNYNTASGYQALQSNTTGNSNTAFGAAGLITNTTGSKLTAIGTGANVTMDGLVNSTAIGFGANVSTSNTIQLGNSEISSVKTSGKITSGAITYPNTNGTSGQVLTANTNGSATWNTLPPPAASALIGTVAIVNGGTGATNMVDARSNLGLSNVENTADANKPVSTATQSALDLKVDKVVGERLINAAEITKLGNQSGVNTGDQDLSSFATTTFVQGALIDAALSVGSISSSSNPSGATISNKIFKLTPADENNAGILTTGSQNISGVKSFRNDIVVNDINIGKGGGAQANNLAIGYSSLLSNTSGRKNIGIGNAALKFNTSGLENIGVGDYALIKNTIGSYNTAIGKESMLNNLSGEGNSAYGVNSLILNNSGSSNTAVGGNTLASNITGNQNTVIGYGADVSSDGLSNASAFGFNAIAMASNTIQLGNTSISNVKTSGTITAGDITYPNSDGLNGQILTTNGSGTLTWVSPINSASSLSGIVPISSGGTGSSFQNFVDLTNNQSINGVKSFLSQVSIPSLEFNNGAAIWALGGSGTGLNLLQGGCCSRLIVDDLGRVAIGANYSPAYQLDVEGDARFTQDIVVNSLTLGKGAGSNNGVNTAIGYEALAANTDGVYNSAFGFQALTANTSGSYNHALGFQVLASNSTGNNNNAFGQAALTANTTGSDNIAVGTSSLFRNTSADNNIAIGTQALGNSLTGSNNIAIGSQAIFANSTGYNNSATGYQSLQQNSTGYNNTASGYRSLYSNSTGTNNTALGYAADVASDGLFNATAIGNGAIVSASNNIQLGNTDVSNVKTSGTLTAGAVTYPNTDGTNGQVLSTSGSGNLIWTTPSTISIGSIAGNSDANGASITSGVLNLTPADGTNGGVVTTGAQTFAGAKTFSTNISVRGVTIGIAPGDNTTNTVLGGAALGSNTTGTYNTAIGGSTLFRNSTGSQNIAGGQGALENSENGNNNSAIGSNALHLNTSGSGNSAYGVGGLYSNLTGVNNTAIGFGADVSSGGLTNATAIGYSAMVNSSNSIQLGNGDITNVNTSGSLTANAAVSNEITENFTIDPTNAEAYKGKIIICNPSNPITITFSSSLPTGYNCMILQKSAEANKITIAGGSGVIVKNRNNYTATAGNYALLTVVHIGGNILVTAGDMQ